MSYFNPISIGIMLINLALAYHSIRNGRSPLWLLALAVGSFAGFTATIAVWLAYLAFAVIPDAWNSNGMRRFTGGVASAADPGRGYRQKQRDVALVGSADAKRALAEESLKRGLFTEAVDLYQSAMQGPIGEGDPAMLRGLARAQMLAGQGAAAVASFRKLKSLDPAAFNTDAELDYARALALDGQTDAAIAQYEAVVPRYPGEEARARFALLLEENGQQERAQNYFREILESVKGAPGYYRGRQKEFIAIARQHLR